jgi:hypothetical protein
MRRQADQSLVWMSDHRRRPHPTRRRRRLRLRHRRRQQQRLRLEVDLRGVWLKFFFFTIRKNYLECLSLLAFLAESNICQ